jgi:hypothetical protein
MDFQNALQTEWGSNFADAQKPDEVRAHPDLAIFIFEDLRPGQSLSLPESVWNRKSHIKLVEGFGSTNAKHLDALLAFRMRFGNFPTKPHGKKESYETDVEAAFRETAWRQPYGIDGAGLMYSQYLSGTLCDEGYAEILQFKLRP